MVFVESGISIIHNDSSDNVTSDQKNRLKVYISTICLCPIDGIL